MKRALAGLVLALTLAACGKAAAPAPSKAATVTAAPTTSTPPVTHDRVVSIVDQILEQDPGACARMHRAVDNPAIGYDVALEAFTISLANSDVPAEFARP